jgi:hypothetical protein
VSELVLRNRNAGPFGLLDIVDDALRRVFDDIDDVIPPAERAAFIADYKAAAGLRHRPAERRAADDPARRAGGHA